MSTTGKTKPRGARARQIVAGTSVHPPHLLVEESELPVTVLQYIEQVEWVAPMALGSIATLGHQPKKAFKIEDSENYFIRPVSVVTDKKGQFIGFAPHPLQPALRDAEMQRLVDATESKADKADAIQARMRAKAVDLVMNGTSWLTASELFAELPKKPSNAHTVLARWLDQGRIYAMEKSGVRIYPRYAFDAMVEPVPLLKEVLKVLAGRSPFQIASWFESPSNYLDGKRPREVLETNGLAVVTAAQRLVEGAVHG